MNANDIATLTATALTVYDARLAEFPRPKTADRMRAMFAAMTAITTKGDSVTCDARQYGDEMQCACGLTWPADDPEKPACRRQRHVEPGQVPPRTAWALDLERRAVRDRRQPDPATVAAGLPVVLPDEIAHAMAKAAFAQVGAKFSPAEELRAARAAYRVLLDRV